MENIILQILTETATKFIEYYKLNGLCSLDRMTEDFRQISNSMAAQILGAFIDSADNAVCEAKAERKEDRISIHERNVPRTLYTALGTITYKRTYFSTDIGKEYLLDHILGVSPYERIDAGIGAKLVNTAAMHSYARSADIVTGGNISRQSAWNKAMNTGEVAYIPEPSDNTPEVLHIYADEDHVTLQDGSNTIVSLVTVCTGKRAVCKGRNELIEPFHVQGYGMSKETLWDYVYALCAEKFDMERVGKVYIYGDGAAWIQGGLAVFPNAAYVLDTFHYKKRMRSLFSGEVGSQYVLKAHTAVTNNDIASFRATAQTMLDATLRNMPEDKAREKKAERINNNIYYITNNWESIQNSRLPDVIGSCTEALVSHVLSERLSRNPMGWSKKGLSKMAMLRVYVLNGGKIMPSDTIAWKHSDRRLRVADKIIKYDNIVKLQNDDIFKDVKSWRWFEVDCKISGKTTGTKVVLDSLQKLRNVC